MVLEVQDEGGKSMTDTEKSPWRSLLHEFEDEGIVDFTINGHTIEKPSSAAEGQGL